jgi:hypothetical protein
MTLWRLCASATSLKVRLRLGVLSEAIPTRNVGLMTTASLEYTWVDIFLFKNGGLVLIRGK